MVSRSSDLPSFQIKQDDKFFNRLISKESSMSNPSFRVYYGGATGSVPFKWESQPGTPKHPLSDTSLPPLTPPPSYFSNQNYRKPPNRHNPRSKILSLIFPRIGSRKIKNLTSSSLPSPPSSPAVSSPSSSSSSSLFMTTRNPNYSSSKCARRNKFYSFGSETDYGRESSGTGSPSYALCFGISRSNSARVRSSYVK